MDKVFPEKGSACDSALADAIHDLIFIVALVVMTGIFVVLYLMLTGDLARILLAV